MWHAQLSTMQASKGWYLKEDFWLFFTLSFFFSFFFFPGNLEELFAANNRMCTDQVNHLWVCFHLKSLHLEKINMANNISAMNLTTTYCVPLNKLMSQVLILFVAIKKYYYHTETWWALGMQVDNSACYNNWYDTRLNCILANIQKPIPHKKLLKCKVVLYLTKFII